MFTPEDIKELKENEVFVFGSNEGGYHGKGAALFAKEKLNYPLYKSEGLVGKAYGLPTMNHKIQKLPLNIIQVYVKNFLVTAKNNPEKTFYLTKVGCGLAGWTVDDIAPLFEGVLELENVVIPEEFYNILKKK